MALAVIENRDTQVVERELEEDAGGVLARVTSIVEHELHATGQVTLGALHAAFDEAWREITASGPGVPQVGGAATREQAHDDHDA